MSSFFGFKPNPKQQVTNKAKSLFGVDTKIMVTGTRPSPLNCKAIGVSSGSYFVECFIDDKLIATASHRNWRTAYRALVVEVEKAYEKTLTQ